MNELIKYFVNLLILQYRNKPRAKGTIEALAKQTFADSTDKIFPIEVQNSYNLDTAVGAQLDVIGKYLGYDRNLPFPIDDNFVYAEYDESINPNEGYADYYEEKDTKPYLEYRYSSYDSLKVSDDTYRRILKMQSELKNKSLSLANIDEALKSNFDIPEGEVNSGEIYLVEGDKTVEYHISKEMYPTLNTQEKLNAFFEKYFPRPMGCTFSVVRDEYILNAIPHGGAENYTTGTIFESSSGDYEMFYETPNKFSFIPIEYPVFHTLKIKARVKFDTTSISSSGIWTTLNGDSYTNNNMKDLCLMIATTTFSILTNNTKRDGVSASSDYANKWIDITLLLNPEVVGTNTFLMTVECEGMSNQSVNLMYSTPNWDNFPVLWGVAGSISLNPSGLRGAIDFAGCSIEIDGEVKWRGVKNKRS